MKIKSLFSYVDCDAGCGNISKDMTMYEIYSNDDELLYDWHEVPPSWLTFTRRDGYLVVVCSKECMEVISEKMVSNIPRN